MYDADTEININITKQSKSRDLAWIICRLQNTDNQVVPSWSGFNHLVTKSNNPKTGAGMITIINSPAHDYYTLWTVSQNCHKMTTTLDQRYTIITFHEQLYCKAKMLQWYHQKQCEVCLRWLSCADEFFKGHWSASW